MAIPKDRLITKRGQMYSRTPEYLYPGIVQFCTELHQIFQKEEKLIYGVLGDYIVIDV